MITKKCFTEDFFHRKDCSVNFLKIASNNQAPSMLKSAAFCAMHWHLVYNLNKMHLWWEKAFTTTFPSRDKSALPAVNLMKNELNSLFSPPNSLVVISCILNYCCMLFSIFKFQLSFQEFKEMYSIGLSMRLIHVQFQLILSR